MYGGHLLRLNLFILELPPGSFPSLNDSDLEKAQTFDFLNLLFLENIEQMHFCDQKQNSNKNYHSLPTLDRIGHL